MTMFEVKQWIIGLNPNDPQWKKEVESTFSVDKLNEKASSLIAEIGWANIEGLLNHDHFWDKPQGVSNG